VDAELQQALDAWADEQNEVVNSASKAAVAYAPPTQCYFRAYGATRDRVLATVKGALYCKSRFL
jgi:hypothetical protein